MIIAAVDYSFSFGHIHGSYTKKVFQILSNLEGPIHVIRWSNKVQYQRTLIKIENVNQIFGYFMPNDGTKITSFISALPTFQPITLYIFTDGYVPLTDI